MVVPIENKASEGSREVVHRLLEEFPEGEFGEGRGEVVDRLVESVA